MEWLTDILKNLAISRTLIGAIFLTSLAMFLGPQLEPNVIPAAPTEWLAGIFGTMVLTGCLLVFWTIEGIWRMGKVGMRATAKSLNSLVPLSEDERGVISAMGQHPTDALNLANIDYNRTPLTKLEIVLLTRQLEGKGLVRISSSNEEFVYLTQAGRDRALKLHKEDSYT